MRACSFAIWGLALLLLGLTDAGPKVPVAPSVVPHPEVQVKVEPVEEPQQQHEDLEQLYRDNLYPDIEMWRGLGLTTAAIDTTLTKWRGVRPDTIRLLLIYNNRLYLPLQNGSVTECAEPCNHLMRDVVRSFKAWTQKLVFPNVTFLMSVGDTSQCRRRGACAAPFLSFAKRIRVLPPRQVKDPLAWDILVPKPNKKAVAYTHSFPWELKADRAVWRGTRWCDRGAPHHMIGCSRFHVGTLYKAHAELRELMDFGYTRGSPELMVAPLTTADYARYKFVLNLDGFTAAYRLAKLLLVDSVVLKEDSERGEYYYRSLKEYEHFIPVFKHNATDIIDIIREWRRPKHTARLKAISAAASEFSRRYCCPRTRMLYWHKALWQYHSLFPDMQQAVEAKWWPMAQARLQQEQLGQGQDGAGTGKGGDAGAGVAGSVAGGEGPGGRGLKSGPAQGLRGDGGAGGRAG